jgi:hypothetical protein
MQRILTGFPFRILSLPFCCPKYFTIYKTLLLIFEGEIVASSIQGRIYIGVFGNRVHKRIFVFKMYEGRGKQ